MQVSETGESRVRGYLFVLNRSLRSFLPAAVADDAVREVGSHIRERIERTENTGDERAVVERVLAELGPPLRVAQAYSTEMTLDEAVTTGRFVPVLRAVWHLATTSLLGFLWAMVVFTGWALGASCVLLAPLKLLFPNNVGLFVLDGEFHGFGAQFALAPGTELYTTYWIVPCALIVGLAILLGTQRASRAILAWLRSRRSPAKLRLRVEVTNHVGDG
jgi:uncharacterized membrane protein